MDTEADDALTVSLIEAVDGLGQNFLVAFTAGRQWQEKLTRSILQWQDVAQVNTDGAEVVSAELQHDLPEVVIDFQKPARVLGGSN